MSSPSAWLQPVSAAAGPLGDLAAIARWHADVGDPDQSADTIPLIVGAPAAAASAAAVCGVILSRDAASVTPNSFDDDDRLNHHQWMSDCAHIRNEIRCLESVRDDPEALLATVDPQVARLAADIRSLPDQAQATLVDGPVCAAAVLLAHEQVPEVLRWIRPVQLGATPTETLTWDYLRVEPILAVNTRLAGGELADLARATIATAVDLAEAYRGSASTNGGDTT
ncbi:MAG: nicotinate-nucleotide--dimethylbenzimidazole phosphoribosyltransferase [Candidatus Nanopelagicales bacterium]